MHQSDIDLLSALKSGHLAKTLSGAIEDQVYFSQDLEQKDQKGIKVFMGARLYKNLEPLSYRVLFGDFARYSFAIGGRNYHDFRQWESWLTKLPSLQALSFWDQKAYLIVKDKKDEARNHELMEIFFLKYGFTKAQLENLQKFYLQYHTGITQALLSSILWKFMPEDHPIKISIDLKKSDEIDLRRLGYFDTSPHDSPGSITLKCREPLELKIFIKKENKTWTLIKKISCASLAVFEIDHEGFKLISYKGQPILADLFSQIEKPSLGDDKCYDATLNYLNSLIVEKPTSKEKEKSSGISPTPDTNQRLEETPLQKEIARITANSFKTKSTDEKEISFVSKYRDIIYDQPQTVLETLYSRLPAIESLSVQTEFKFPVFEVLKTISEKSKNHTAFLQAANDQQSILVATVIDDAMNYRKQGKVSLQALPKVKWILENLHCVKSTHEAGKTIEDLSQFIMAFCDAFFQNIKKIYQEPLPVLGCGKISRVIACLESLTPLTEQLGEQTFSYFQGFIKDRKFYFLRYMNTVIPKIALDIKRLMNEIRLDPSKKSKLRDTTQSFYMLTNLYRKEDPDGFIANIWISLANLSYLFLSAEMHPELEKIYKDFCSILHSYPSFLSEFEKTTNLGKMYWLIKEAIPFLTVFHRSSPAYTGDNNLIFCIFYKIHSFEANLMDSKPVDLKKIQVTLSDALKKRKSLMLSGEYALDEDNVSETMHTLLLAIKDLLIQKFVPLIVKLKPIFAGMDAKITSLETSLQEVIEEEGNLEEFTKLRDKWNTLTRNSSSAQKEVNTFFAEAEKILNITQPRFKLSESPTLRLPKTPVTLASERLFMKGM